MWKPAAPYSPTSGQIFNIICIVDTKLTTSLLWHHAASTISIADPKHWHVPHHPMVDLKPEHPTYLTTFLYLRPSTQVSDRQLLTTHTPAVMWCAAVSRQPSCLRRREQNRWPGLACPAVLCGRCYNWCFVCSFFEKKNTVLCVCERERVKVTGGGI